MTLRTRLLLGYALLVLLLIATGVAGSVGFREISEIVSERLDHFTATTRSANALLRAVEHQDRVLLHSLIAPSGRPYASELEAAHEELLVALDGAAELADAEQMLLIERIRHAEPAFVLARDRTLAAPEHGDPTRADTYEREFVPAFLRLRAPCAALVKGSRQHMHDARDAVRNAATSGSILLGVLVTIGLLSLIALARGMRTHVLERLDELRRFSEAIASGEEHQRARITGNDELSRLAFQVNAMLDRQAALEGRLEGRLAQDREMLVGMLDAFGPNALLLSTAGDLITWSGGMPEPSVLDEITLRVRERSRGLGRDEEAPDAAFSWTPTAGPGWHVRPLRAEGERVTGWLARPEGRGS